MQASASSCSLSPPAQLRPRGSSVNTQLPTLSLLQSNLFLPNNNPSSSAPATPSATTTATAQVLSVAKQALADSLPQEPQTPSSLVRKNTAPTTLVVPPPSSSSRYVAPHHSSSSNTSSTSSSGSRPHRNHHHNHRSSRSPHSPVFASRVNSIDSIAGLGSASTSAIDDQRPPRARDQQDGYEEDGIMLAGSPHRPMLSVLLSMGMAALPPLGLPGGNSAMGTSSLSMHRARSGGAHVRRKKSQSNRSISLGSHRQHSRGHSRASSQTWDAPPSATSPSSTTISGVPPSPYTSLFTPAPNASFSVAPRRRTPATATLTSHRLQLASRSSSYWRPILFLLSLFVLSTIPVFLSIYSLPLRSFISTSTRFPPKTLSDISSLASSLQAYASSNSRHAFLHTLAVLSITAIWKHAWSIPGSVLVNVIAGTLMQGPTGGVLGATLWMTLLTTIGSLCASALSMPLGPIVRTFFPRALEVTRSALQGSSSSPSSSSTPSMSRRTRNGRTKSRSFEMDELDEKLHAVHAEERKGGDTTPTWVRLVVMRLVGVVPWSGINVACGVCGVSFWDCFIGTFIGTLPWTAVTCQVGDILRTVSSSASTLPGAQTQTLGSVLASPSVIFKLVLLSALSLGPVLYREKLASVLGGSSKASAAAAADNVAPENGSGSISPATIDEEHLLPLVHSHPQTTTTLLQVPKRSDSAASTSSASSSSTFAKAKSGSETSSTVGGDDLERGIVTDVEYASPYDEEDDVDVDGDLYEEDGEDGHERDPLVSSNSSSKPSLEESSVKTGKKWYHWRWRDERRPNVHALADGADRDSERGSFEEF